MTSATQRLLNFGEAIEALKSGGKVARRGWNGKGMWLILLPATSIVSPDPETPAAPCIAMFTTQGVMQPGWHASQPDMLANDWEIVK